MEKQNMDKAIREKLEMFSQQPPLHVWDNIQGQLQAQKRKRRIVLYSRIAAAALVVMAFLAGWYFNEKSDRATPALTETGIEQSQSTRNTENNVTGAGTGNEVLTENIKSEPIENSAEEQKSISETLIQEEEITDFTAEVQNQQPSGEPEIPVAGGRNNLKLLNKIEAFVGKNEDKKLHLKEEETTPVNKINKTDELLIAENIRNMKNREDDESKWRVGIQVSPGYSSETSSHSEAYSNSMAYSNESGNINISGGFSVQMKAGKKWSVESGVFYARNGGESNGSHNWFDGAYSSVAPLDNAPGRKYANDVNISDGLITMNSVAGVIELSGTPGGTEVATDIESPASNSGTLLTDGEFSQVLDFIEVPLYLRYSILDSKFGLEVLGGLNAGIVVGNKVYLEDENVGKTKDISTLNISGAIGVGLSYNLNKHISLAVEPRFNYYLNSINQNPDISFRPYRIGIYTGLYYEF
jgi:hypothetical protein